MPDFPKSGLTTGFDPGVFYAPVITAMNAVHSYNLKNGAVMRLSTSFYSLNTSGWEADYEAAQELIANSKSDDVFSDSIKLNVDASLDTGTGYIKAPYVGRFEGSHRSLKNPIADVWWNGINTGHSIAPSLSLLRYCLWEKNDKYIADSNVLKKHQDVFRFSRLSWCVHRLFVTHDAKRRTAWTEKRSRATATLWQLICKDCRCHCPWRAPPDNRRSVASQGLSIVCQN